MSEQLIPLGEIVAPHGIGGWVKLKPYNPATAVFASVTKILLEKDGIRSAHFIEASRPHKNQFLLKLRGIDSIGAATPWVGSVLCVEQEILQPLAPGEYYYYQVTGLDVFDLQGAWIGVVTRIWPTAGGDLYVVKGASKEYLIPAVKEVIEKVDLAERKMIINPPDGLLDL